jgi:hypothetical protein
MVGIAVGAVAVIAVSIILLAARSPHGGDHHDHH